MEGDLVSCELVVFPLQKRSREAYVKKTQKKHHVIPNVLGYIGIKSMKYKTLFTVPMSLCHTSIKMYISPVWLWGHSRCTEFIGSHVVWKSLCSLSCSLRVVYPYRQSCHVAVSSQKGQESSSPQAWGESWELNSTWVDASNIKKSKAKVCPPTAASSPVAVQLRDRTGPLSFHKPSSLQPHFQADTWSIVTEQQPGGVEFTSVTNSKVVMVRR